MKLPGWFFPSIEHKQTKQAMRRVAHTHLNTKTGRFHFDIGRYLDRSKYNGDGSKK